MRLSPAAELAVRGVLILAENHGQRPVTLETICKRRDLPRQYLVKIFASLARAELVTPIRGKRGGYVLAREPRDVTILDVIEAVEGPLVLNLCQHDPPKCQQTNCPIRPLWGRLQDAVRRELGGMTLQNCLEPVRDEAIS